MNTIFSCGVFGEPYRIVVSDDLLHEVRSAQSILRKLPWNGEMFLPVPLFPLNVTNTIRSSHAEIVVGKNSVSVCIDGPEGRESFINSDDLLTIPDIYLSREFEYDLGKYIFDLTLHDIELVAIWKALKERNIEDS